MLAVENMGGERRGSLIWFWLSCLIVCLLFGFSRGTICTYCGKDFKVLGRHIWRCKSRVIINSPVIAPSNNPSVSTQGSDYTESPSRSLVNLNNNHGEIPSEACTTEYDIELQNETSNTCAHNKDIDCVCGKKCKGLLKGLRAHRRFCDVNTTLNLDSLFTSEYYNSNSPPTQSQHLNNDVQNNSCPTNISAGLFNDKKLIKNGIKLPKSSAEWEEANLYFTGALDYNSEITDVDFEIGKLQDEIYNYFQQTTGAFRNAQNDIAMKNFQQKYNHLSRRLLKKQLRHLKSLQNAELSTEIRYISKLLRFRYSKRTHILLNVNEHDKRMTQTFWKYCKEIFEDDETTLPDFDEKTCADFFRAHLKPNTIDANFEFPIWMKRLHTPCQSFNVSTPSYSEITKIIKRMKSSSSACPFDQISVLTLKNCPILRTALHRIIQHYWKTKSVPRIWKHSFTILIYKKDSPKIPSNFRPITLQPVFAEVYSALIRNRVFDFMNNNDYIETNIQKGFCKGISRELLNIRNF